MTPQVSLRACAGGRLAFCAGSVDGSTISSNRCVAWHGLGDPGGNDILKAMHGLPSRRCRDRQARAGGPPCRAALAASLEHRDSGHATLREKFFVRPCLLKPLPREWFAPPHGFRWLAGEGRVGGGGHGHAWLSACARAMGRWRAWRACMWVVELAAHPPSRLASGLTGATFAAMVRNLCCQGLAASCPAAQPFSEATASRPRCRLGGCLALRAGGHEVCGRSLARPARDDVSDAAARPSPRNARHRPAAREPRSRFAQPSAPPRTAWPSTTLPMPTIGAARVKFPAPRALRLHASWRKRHITDRMPGTTRPQRALAQHPGRCTDAGRSATAKRTPTYYARVAAARTPLRIHAWPRVLGPAH
jgi:hypothetical protein